jgi:hypothetical protein
VAALGRPSAQKCHVTWPTAAEISICFADLVRQGLSHPWRPTRHFSCQAVVTLATEYFALITSKRTDWRSQRLICGERGGPCVCPTRACQDHRPVKASGGVPETPLTKGYNDVGLDLCDQDKRCSLASHGFPFALRGSMRRKEHPMRHRALCPQTRGQIRKRSPAVDPYTWVAQLLAATGCSGRTCALRPSEQAQWYSGFSLCS